MAKRYRMTPARRAALARAQKISARKRRKASFVRGAKAVGSVAGTIAVGAAVHHANSALRDFSGYAEGRKKDVATVKKLFGHGPKVDPNAPGVKLKSNRKPVRYYGRGRPAHIRGTYAGTRIRSRV
jgi:hypothetical protein